MSLPLLQSLETSLSDQDIITSLGEIVKADQNQYRCEETTKLIASKRRIIESNQKNDLLVSAIGDFFLWFMPQAATPALEEALKFARQFCNNEPIINLFVDILLPNATSQNAIYCICRSICRIAFLEVNDRFNSNVAVTALLDAMDRATDEQSLQWSICALHNIARHADSSFFRFFMLPRARQTLFSAFKRSPNHDCLEYLTRCIFHITEENPGAEHVFFSEEFGVLLHEKLVSATNPDAIGMVALAIGNFAIINPDFHLFTGEIMYDALMKATTTMSSFQVTTAIANVFATSKVPSPIFGTEKFAKALIHVYEIAGDDDEAVRSVSNVVANICGQLPETRQFFRTEEALRAIVKGLEISTTISTAIYGASVMGNISCDESVEVFASRPVLRCLIRAYKLDGVENASRDDIQSMNNAVNNVLIQNPANIPFFAAHYPHLSDTQRQLQNVATAAEFIPLLKRGHALFSDDILQYDKYRLLSFLLEKCDTDAIISTDDQKMCNEAILAFAAMYEDARMHIWAILFDDTWDDTVGLALLSRSTAQASIEVLRIIKSRRELYNGTSTDLARCNVSRALVAMILDKLIDEDWDMEVTSRGVSLWDVTRAYLEDLLDDERTSGVALDVFFCPATKRLAKCLARVVQKIGKTNSISVALFIQSLETMAIPESSLKQIKEHPRLAEVIKTFGM